MPKTKRDSLKRQIAHAHLNVKLAMQHLANVEAQFHDVHPEMATAMQVCVVGLNEVQNVIEKFWSTSWGPLPTNWDSVRNVPQK